jgi:hypothetical protein
VLAAARLLRTDADVDERMRQLEARAARRSAASGSQGSEGSDGSSDGTDGCGGSARGRQGSPRATHAADASRAAGVGPCGDVETEAAWAADLAQCDQYGLLPPCRNANCRTDDPWSQ